jgi:hypothetical protein
MEVFVIKRSILSIVAGIIFVTVVTTLVDLVLYVNGVFPQSDQPLSDALAILATSYRVIIGIIGAWLTARLAPYKPMKHALILGLTGTGLGLVVIAVSWGKEIGPAWYPIAVAVLAIPQSWAGGQLFEIQSARKSSQRLTGG